MSLFSKKTVLDNSKVVALNQLSGENYKGQREFDLIVKVISMIKKRENICEIRMLDNSDEIWYAEVFQPKFRWLRSGQLVKVKAANVVDQEKQMLELKWASNILTIPNNFYITRQMKADEK
jgi:hypothetical protein